MNQTADDIAANAPIDAEFTALAAEATPDAPRPGPDATPQPAAAPPVDQELVGMLVMLLSGGGAMIAPRWVSLIYQRAAEAKRAGADGPQGIELIATLAAPLVDRWVPDAVKSPWAKLLGVTIAVVAPCIGEPLRDPPPKKETDKGEEGAPA